MGDVRPFAVTGDRAFDRGRIEFRCVVITAGSDAENRMIRNHLQSTEPDLWALVVVRIVFASIEKLLDQCGAYDDRDDGDGGSKQKQALDSNSALPGNPENADADHDD